MLDSVVIIGSSIETVQAGAGSCLHASPLSLIYVRCKLNQPARTRWLLCVSLLFSLASPKIVTRVLGCFQDARDKHVTTSISSETGAWIMVVLSVNIRGCLLFDHIFSKFPGIPFTSLWIYCLNVLDQIPYQHLAGHMWGKGCKVHSRHFLLQKESGFSLFG